MLPRAGGPELHIDAGCGLYSPRSSQDITGASDIQRIVAPRGEWPALFSHALDAVASGPEIAKIPWIRRFCDIVSLAIEGMEGDVVHSLRFILGWFQGKSRIISFTRRQPAGRTRGK